MIDHQKIAAAIAAHDAEPGLPCPGAMINGLELRKRLGPKLWGVPQEFGCCGWTLNGLATGRMASIIVTGDHKSDAATGAHWVHASIRCKHRMPEYEDLKLLHRAVFGDNGWAYQVFAPTAEHVNIHEHVLHLFGRLDGARVLPDFGRFGTI